MTVSELGRKLKRKHPDKFGHLTDADAGRQAKREFPDDYGHYRDEGLSVKEPDGLHFPRKVEALWKKHDPKMGIIVSYFRKHRVLFQNEFIEAAIKQQRLLIEQAALISEEVIRQEKAESDLELFLTQNNHQIAQLKIDAHLTQKAAENGLTSQAYVAVNTHQAIEKINLDNRIAEMEQRVRLAIISKTLTGHQKIILVQELLDNLYKQMEEIGNDRILTEGTRDRMIADREDIVTRFKAYIDAEGTRLLSADNR